jgi:hypothetical protein
MNYIVPNELIQIMASNLDSIKDLLMFSRTCKKYYKLIWNDKFREIIIRKCFTELKTTSIIKVSEKGELIKHTINLYYCMKCGEHNELLNKIVSRCFSCLSKSCNKDSYIQLPCDSANYFGSKICKDCIKSKGYYIESTRNTAVSKEIYNSLANHQKIDYRLIE